MVDYQEGTTELGDFCCWIGYEGRPRKDGVSRRGQEQGEAGWARR